MTGERVTPLSSNIDKDYLEMLIHKLNIMRKHGADYYARKMETDRKLFEAAKKNVNEYLMLLKKRGYSGDRFATVTPAEQQRLF